MLWVAAIIKAVTPFVDWALTLAPRSMRLLAMSMGRVLLGRNMAPSAGAVCAAATIQRRQPFGARRLVHLRAGFVDCELHDPRPRSTAVPSHRPPPPAECRTHSANSRRTAFASWRHARSKPLEIRGGICLSRRLRPADDEVTKQMRVATYTRISTDEENQPYSLEAQADRLSSFIHSQDGWEPRRKFTDQMSGSTLDRPGLEQALAEARLGAFDLLLVYRVDRLSRSVRGLAQISGRAGPRRGGLPLRHRALRHARRRRVG